MSDVVIKAEGLGKKYLIGHQRERERYTALRDVLARNVKSVLSKTRQVLSGQQLLAGDEIEEFWALRDIDFEIKRGDRVGIIGRNGAGKSTLLKVLSRITEPSTGRVEIHGRVASLLEVGTGFHPELTGRENIFLNGAILGMTRAEIKKKFDEIVDFAGVEKFLDTPVKRYSSGMYVRLAFAVAAHMEPEILVVDEVLAVGDAEFQKKCLGKMEDVSKNEGRTVLFVSHNMGVVAQLCQRAILLSGGVKISENLTHLVLDQYLSYQQKDDNEYIVKNSLIHSKRNIFFNVFCSNSTGKKESIFNFEENIYINFKFQIKDHSIGLQIGIGLNDQLNNRIFTIIKPIDYFIVNQDGFCTGSAKLPSSLIAPGHYSFVMALWNKSGNVSDLLEEICCIKIIDNNSEFPEHEGGNNGAIIINPLWNNA